MVVTGVRIFSGLADWEGDRAVGRPLLEITSLCGLRLGPQDAVDHRQFGGGLGRQTGKQRPALRVVAEAGKRVGCLNPCEDAPGHRQGVMGEEPHAASDCAEVSLAASRAARSATARSSLFTPTSEVPLARSDSRLVSVNSRLDSQTREAPAEAQ